VASRAGEFFYDLIAASASSWDVRAARQMLQPVYSSNKKGGREYLEDKMRVVETTG